MCVWKGGGGWAEGGVGGAGQERGVCICEGTCIRVRACELVGVGGGGGGGGVCMHTRACMRE